MLEVVRPTSGERHGRSLVASRPQGREKRKGRGKKRGEAWLLHPPARTGAGRDYNLARGGGGRKEKREDQEVVFFMSVSRPGNEQRTRTETTPKREGKWRSLDTSADRAIYRSKQEKQPLPNALQQCYSHFRVPISSHCGPDMKRISHVIPLLRPQYQPVINLQARATGHNFRTLETTGLSGGSKHRSLRFLSSYERRRCAHR